MEEKKSGFVTIIGKPNVGKSTLINKIIDRKVSIATHRKNTTRNQIRGIYNRENVQIVFIDTPGFLSEYKTKLNLEMQKRIKESLIGVDIILFLIPFWEKFDDDYLRKITLLNLGTEKNFPKKYCIITKIDLIKGDEGNELKELVQAIFQLNYFDKIIPISGLKNLNIDLLIEEIKSDLTDNIFHYSEKDFKGGSDQFYIQEIIREKILLYLNEEIPHNIFVQLKNISIKNKLISIEADIIVNRESLKRIVIGKEGIKIKQIGENARKEIEKYFENKKVFLNLIVKVKKDWENKDSIIKGI
ncbi:GTPase Era [Candidatus Hepatoplasma crinochetorum]|uniref:GTPase Era n=1 Tax=Candidatus Hepatoplasma crinochetorum Av TaxID=1427984 RepID=W8GFU8_9MOLU|nr:GTPase Era [Candidatus Hepatoplasma crinochetorum]AHK22443.1 GTPase Era [Candidatus Hepatoplasma crinochetorum Av]BDV03032.1 MAG: GTPase Era [Candidatus Hepatoplasma crinochetorum]